MKVALVVPGGVDASGTHRVIPCLLWQIERLARACELHVFSVLGEPAGGRYELLGARVRVAGERPARARTLAALAAEHRRAPFDVIQGFWASPVAAAAGALLRRPVTLHLPGGDLASLPEIGYGRLRTRGGRLGLRAMARATDVFTVPSEPLRKTAEGLGLRAERIPSGVDLGRWPPLAPRRRDPESEARLLFVASLNRVKDPWTLVRAAAALKEAGLRFRLDVIGVDTLGGEIQRLAADLDVGDRVRFHGFLPQDAVRPWMERADVLLLTSRHEGGPIVALEAAATGVPTVGPPVGHLAEWAGGAAVTVPFADPAALARAVVDLLRDEERRLVLAAQAQRRALAEDADHTARLTLDLYHRLTGR